MAKSLCGQAAQKKIKKQKAAFYSGKRPFLLNKEGIKYR
ncbi:hypothetical protein CL3_17840 [butyrate-producing bacterium SM4/1]|nr:hypothetical protein CL3_17840 [butyrate-producing bacterium SM4/1]